MRAIVGQQLSTHAARAIYDRLLDALRRQAANAAADPRRRARRAARRRRALAREGRVPALTGEHVESGALEIDRLTELSDDEVIAELVAVKGIGAWTPDIFLMFTLGRPDVLAVGDLGIRRAVQRAYGLPAPPTPAELTELAEPWRPYRTAACLVLWHSLTNAPV